MLCDGLPMISMRGSDARSARSEPQETASHPPVDSSKRIRPRSRRSFSQ